MNPWPLTQKLCSKIAEQYVVDWDIDIVIPQVVEFM